MTDAYLTIQTLGFATGTVLFGLLCVFSHRAGRLAHGRRGVEAAVAAWFWNAGGVET
jgi:uncharacterized membrane protein YdcZ (DUF606 family)